MELSFQSVGTDICDYTYDMCEIHSFDPTIPQPEVDRLWRKLRDTRLPEQPVVPDAGDDYGPPLDWIHQLYGYWANNFDWDTAQRRIASWKNYTTEIEGLTIHFVHQPSRQDDAIPLLLAHGWPGSWFEFSRCIDPLSNPAGDDTSTSQSRPQPAFHVVVPSIPGFTWSSGPPGRGWTLQDTARIFDTLMHERLGYGSYVAQGGDWGHWVVRVARQQPPVLQGPGAGPCTRNMCPSQPPVPRSECTSSRAGSS
ncbi:Alpha/Beta hydrolase protein [Xylariaceae sp. FL0594]|nr:Alpha/Beta hydrolase protein [Xylariaceae sp. FL0594]